MTILTATEGRTIYPSAGDIHRDILDIGLHVEEHAWVALTGTIEIAGYGVSCNLTQCARNAECGIATEVDGSIAIHIGQLVTTIDIGQDMSAGDIYFGIATNITSLPVPFTCGVWEVTRAATEDIAIEGAAVACNAPTALGRFVCCPFWYCWIFVQVTCLIGKYIVVGVGRFILPACTFGQRIFISSYTGEVTIRPLRVCITSVKTISSSSCFI